MAIEIHIMTRKSDWHNENELAYMLAKKINSITNDYEINIPITIHKVEDTENKMEELFPDNINYKMRYTMK